MKRIDLSGKKFGKLTVIGYSHSDATKSGQKRAMWSVVCDCGNTNLISTANLSVTKSCGCLKKQGLNKKEFGVAASNLKFSRYKSSAKKRQLSFELTKKQFLEIVEKPCFYCGAIKASKTQHKDLHGYFESNGIDRIDSGKGYVAENCVSCCPTCNTMKMDMTQEQFYAQITKILRHVHKS